MFPSFQFQWLADEVRKNLPQELDFRLEANNMNKCSQLFKSSGITFVKVQIISSYSFWPPLIAFLSSLYGGPRGLRSHPEATHNGVL